MIPGNRFAKSRAEPAGVEIDGSVALLAEDRARDDVARRQLRQRVSSDA